MICPNCYSSSWHPQGICSNCRYSRPRPSSFGGRHPALLISLALAIALGAVATAVSGFLVLKKNGYFKAFEKAFEQGYQEGLRRSQNHKNSLPVEHGAAVRPDDLTGHGQLYFVPVGRQTFSAQSLADYYAHKFAIHVTVLPAVAVRSSDCVPERRQCFAEELMADMTAAYPEIAQNPASVMIALTDEDIRPREEGWEFTYSWHSARIGIVSSWRMNPSSWGGRRNDAIALASTRQMLTKYIAMQYFHLPDSLDPSSVMFTPLTPNGGPDDLHESDLHPEASVNGRRGTPYACLYFTYSYESDTITPDNPVLSDCRYGSPASDVAHETFQTNLGVGYLIQRAMDFQMDSKPAIVFRRAYSSGYSRPLQLGLGWNTGHSFNTYIGSDGYNAQTHINLFHEDGTVEYFARLDHSRGFDPNYAFQTSDHAIYGARLTWAGNHYKLTYRDGSVSTFLPCTSDGVLCLWTGHQDADGNSLLMDRTPDRELPTVTASDNQAISFHYNKNRQVTDAEATNGQRVSYDYADDGCLASVHRTDGTVALYEYDQNHRMTSFSVKRGNASPKRILTNEYDDRGRITRQTLADVGTFSIEYLAERNGYASELRITDPAGQIFDISSGQTDYIVRTTPIKFPAVPGR